MRVRYKYKDRIIKAGKKWTDDNGITHPINWEKMSDEKKAKLGLVKLADPVNGYSAPQE